MSKTSDPRALATAQIYKYAKVVRTKLVREASRPDHRLGRLVGHVNLLNALVENLDREYVNRLEYDDSDETSRYLDCVESAKIEQYNQHHEEYDSSSSNDRDNNLDLSGLGNKWPCLAIRRSWRSLSRISLVNPPHRPFSTVRSTLPLRADDFRESKYFSSPRPTHPSRMTTVSRWTTGIVRLPKSLSGLVTQCLSPLATFSGISMLRQRRQKSHRVIP